MRRLPWTIRIRCLPLSGIGEAARGELKDLMVYGSFAPVDSVEVPHSEDEAVYAYTRTGGPDGTDANQSLLVVSNFTSDSVERTFSLLDECACSRGIRRTGALQLPG